MRILFIALGVIIIASVSVAAGAAYSSSKAKLNVLRSDNEELQGTLLSLQDEASDLSRRVFDSIGNKLVVTEATYEELPKTITEARDQGYSLMDTVDGEGKLTEAACFAHEGARHYAKRGSKITDGVEWHGAPILLLYNIDSEKLIGMVLESTSPQPAPPWEYHAKGHPGMGFPHWSLHFWFIEPPENLSLAHTH